MIFYRAKDIGSVNTSLWCLPAGAATIFVQKILVSQANVWCNLRMCHYMTELSKILHSKWEERHKAALYAPSTVKCRRAGLYACFMPRNACSHSVPVTAISSFPLWCCKQNFHCMLLIMNVCSMYFFYCLSFFMALNFVHMNMLVHMNISLLALLLSLNEKAVSLICALFEGVLFNCLLRLSLYTRIASFLARLYGVSRFSCWRCGNLISLAAKRIYIRMWSWEARNVVGGVTLRDASESSSDH